LHGIEFVILNIWSGKKSGILLPLHDKQEMQQ
jgi:hypothetical protein